MLVCPQNFWENKKMQDIKNLKPRLQRKVDNIRCYLSRNRQRSTWPDRSKGYLTIFFDYEGDYSKPGKGRDDLSVYGVKRILEICKKNNIKATFNTVGKLFYDYPDIIKQIIQDGHDMASHSFKHDDISTLNREEIDNDIKLTQQAFEAFGLDLCGMRSPQNRWSFKQLERMLGNGLAWSAEGDPAEYPYVIYKKSGKRLVRFPVTFDDYLYISKNFTADEMYDKLIEVVTNIKDLKKFGAIGFHPWINGADKSRLQTMENFFKYISRIQGLTIVTFSEAYNSSVAYNNIQKTGKYR